MIQHHLAFAPLLDQRKRRLARYSRYNASEKGRARVERYRATPSIILSDGRVMERKGTRNRETSHWRRVDKRIAATEARLCEQFGGDLVSVRRDLTAAADRIVARYVAVQP